MALIQPDRSEIQEDVSPGEYSVRATGAELGEWTNERGTTKYISWTLETVNEAEPKNNGRKIWYKTPFTGKGAFLTIRLYEAATGERLTKESGAFDTEQIIGREFKVTVDRNDKGYIEVKAVSKVQ